MLEISRIAIVGDQTGGVHDAIDRPREMIPRASGQTKVGLCHVTRMGGYTFRPPRVFGEFAEVVVEDAFPATARFGIGHRAHHEVQGSIRLRQ